MDETHLHAAARYVSLNPVRARLAARAEDWPWSSARARLTGRDDGVVNVAPLLEREPDWANFLAGGLDTGIHAAFQSAERTGRPLGDEAFTARLEQSLGRTLARQKPGRKPKAAVEGEAVLL
jgi:putative transposase